MRRRVSIKANAGHLIVNDATEEQAKQTKNSTTTKNKNEKLVKFSSKVEVRLIDRIVDPEIKKALFYNRQDIWIFRKRLEVAITLRRQIRSALELQSKMKEDQVFLLDQHLLNKEQENNGESSRASSKRSLVQQQIAATKRRRLQTTPAA
eukprot:CAMPEP_0119003666 /NCGR_PEP_ID=MMETSP1176-20130426/697_1 /TAXON_ID=265551 /ORGANISM="Synedropsis recta cf, Strain CCMP1620" /LENGTH=149 /DNA_ID=CAMNT_0006955283 /DNA_START=73 /DNA_END=522 /DNA_ORIENTATION=+